ncbi:uncharacterized protein [Cicer arietinum]|uniref:Uncharacterized protein LOC105851871 n=1 Tax=Cicer arietinum TaxID=3827 RepID=A0A1S3E3G1_CICAR|nr:uncharacterized protein LOC105851871 [Cicer arietinum]
MGGKIGLTRENIGASLGFFTNVSPVLGSRIVQSVVEVSKMAWLISTSFTVPLCVNKGVHELDSAMTKLSKKATITTAQNIIGSCSSNKHTLFVEGSGSCQRCLISLARFLHDSYSSKEDVNYCAKIVISGYWVGPDADDGWGFVEAIIDQIT